MVNGGRQNVQINIKCRCRLIFVKSQYSFWMTVTSNISIWNLYDHFMPGIYIFNNFKYFLTYPVAPLSMDYANLNCLFVCLQFICDCTLHKTNLWCGFCSPCQQVQQVSLYWEFQAPKEMMVSQGSQESLDLRGSLVRSAQQVYVTAVEAVTELHSKQVSCQKI